MTEGQKESEKYSEKGRKGSKIEAPKKRAREGERGKSAEGNS